MIFKCNVSTAMLKVTLFKVINARYGIILRGNLSPPILCVNHIVFKMILYVLLFDNILCVSNNDKKEGP